MKEQPKLVRGLGLIGASSIVVGTTIGSGVFLVSSEMTRGMGTPRGVFFIWILGGLLSLTGALAYAELSAMMPEAGGEYTFLREAYGPLWGFLYGWMQFLIGKPGSLATLGAGFARYFSYFFPSLSQKLVAFSIIALLAFVNYFGVRTSGAVQTIFTLLKIALIVGLGVGAFAFGHGSWSNFSTSIPVGNAMSGFVAALVAALWAYDGWNNVSMVAGEVEKPSRNLPLSLIAGTAVIGALYIGVNVAYFYILPADKVASAQRVAADVAKVFMGNAGGAFVAIAAMVSIFAAINGSILTGSRVPFAMAADGRFFSGIAKVHPRFHAPSNAVVFLCVIAALLSLTGTYEQLFNYVIFGSWIFYGITAASVIALRIKRPDAVRPYRTWGYPVLPIVFVLVAAALSVSILYENPGRSVVGLLIIAAGVPAFYYFERKRAIPAVGAAILLALSLGVAPHATAAPRATSAAAPRVAGRHATAPHPTTARPSLMVFALGDRAGIRSLSEHAANMDVLSPQAFVAHSDGRLTGRIHPDLARAHVAMMPAVVNEDFSTPALGELLASRRARARLANSLVATAKQFHLRGFVIDFEGLSPTQREHYTIFLSDAHRLFHNAGLSLGVAIPPALGKWRDAYDFRAIGRACDTVIVMAYDQHSRLSPPGPIAGYNWVERALEETLAFVAHEKVLLGVPLYHRKWTDSDPATTGTHREAMALRDAAGAETQWDNIARSPWFDLPGQRVWFEDSRSLSEKLDLARRYKLAGVAAWRLGQEDPGVWNVFQEYRRSR